MIRLFSVIALLALVAAPAQANCEGRDIIATLPTAERDALVQRAEAAPYPRGNLWQAERAGRVIHVVGTFHIGDPRLAPMMERLAPLITEADRVVVETTPEEESRLAAALADTPDLAFITVGPTLREVLAEPEWELYASEMDLRGVPAFVASRFRPWLAFATLSIPACITGQEPELMRGLDDRIITYARELSVPVEGLETAEVVFELFDTLTEEEALDILRATLVQAELSEDMFATLADAYFAGEHRLIWEFSRSWIPEGTQGLFPLARQSDLFDRLEEALLLRRNRNWVEQLLAGTDDERLLLAVGAAHLGGREGVLQLLEQAGFTLQRLEF